MSADKVLLTGATGWLGQALSARLLAEGAATRLRALVPVEDDAEALRTAGVEIVRGDLRDQQARAAFLYDVAGAKLIHLAGIIHPPLRTGLFDEVNFRAGVDLVDDATTAGLSRIVVMSSNSPFGANPTPEHVFTEESPFNPYMGYGRSKWRLETALGERRRQGRWPEIVIVRAPWFYGPYQPPRQSLFFTMIRKGRFPLVGDGHNRRSMAYVDNLADGILAALTHPNAKNEAFWIADERPYPMLEIIETVRAVLKEDFGLSVAPKYPRVPGVIADVARLADWGLQGLGLYQQKIHVLSEMNLTIACSIEKAKARIGYSPKVELREGMRRSIAWCLERNIEI